MKCFLTAVFFLAVLFANGKVFADEKQDMLNIAQKIVAEDERRFGIDVKKCRHECQRVYSKEHCVAKCSEISDRSRAETFQREAEDEMRDEAEKPLKYKEIAEKYR